MNARKIPAWARAVQLADRAAWYAYRAQEALRDELLSAWLDPSLRGEIIRRAYARQEGYLEGGATFERGLFDWEARALGEAPFPPHGTLLLGAAGGGRELHVLAARGYRVLAFEPNERLLAGAQTIAAQHPGCQVLRGSYQDLAAAAQTGTGPLAELVREQAFDAVVLGWGSFTHLLDEHDQLATLKATRALAPNAPVLLSFFLRSEPDQRGRAERLRGALRTVFTKLGAPPRGEGLAYEMNGGFVYFFTKEEIVRLAFQAGYEVQRFEAAPFPHAVLLPLG